LSSSDILRTGRLQMRTFALLGAKTSDFSKGYVCPQGQGGRGFKPVM